MKVKVLGELSLGRGPSGRSPGLLQGLIRDLRTPTTGQWANGLFEHKL